MVAWDLFREMVYFLPREEEEDERESEKNILIDFEQASGA